MSAGPSDVFVLDTERDLDQLIAATNTAGFPGREALYRLVRQRRLLVMECTRDAVFSIKLLKAQTKPVVVLLGDDDYQTTGPSAWVSLPKLLRWAKRGVLHATGGDARTYEMAASLAMVCRRLILVETSSAAMAEWGRAFTAARPSVPFVGIVPPAGEAHPVIPDRSAQH